MQLNYNGRVIQLETNTADEFRSEEQSMVYYHHMTMASNLEIVLTIPSQTVWAERALQDSQFISHNQVVHSTTE
jgi:hypothetical protein